MTAKQGRNGRCACGSGVKFKRCHGFVQAPTNQNRTAPFGHPDYVHFGDDLYYEGEHKYFERGRAAVALLLAMAGGGR